MGGSEECGDDNWEGDLVPGHNVSSEDPRGVQYSECLSPILSKMVSCTVTSIERRVPVLLIRSSLLSVVYEVLYLLSCDNGSYIHL